MIYFNCDYLEGGHPKILEKMLSTNMEQLTGYSTDHYCDSARERIRQACGCPDADVHFLVGGTPDQFDGNRFHSSPISGRAGSTRWSHCLP